MDGDILRLEIQGSTMTIKLNGVQLGATVNDASHTTGSAGMAFSSVDNNSFIDTWEGGDFGQTGGAYHLTIMRSRLRNF